MLVFWIVLGILVLPLVVELTVRVVLRRGRYFVWRPYTQMRSRLEAEALPTLPAKPRLSVNSLGERAGPPPPTHDPSVFHVLVVGGSAAECYFLDDQASWPGVLQANLSQPENLQQLQRSSVHVGNIARSGTGPSEAVARVLEKVRSNYADLDVILILCGASDMLNWMRTGTPEVINEGLPIDDIFEQHPEIAFGWAPRRTASAELMRRALLRFKKTEVVRDRVGKKLTEARAMRARARVIHEETPDPTNMIQSFETWIRKALPMAQGMAKRVIFVRQPWFAKETYTEEEKARFWNLGLGDPYHEDVAEYFSTAAAGRLMAQISATAGQVCDELGIEHLDLIPVLEPSARTYYDFFHLTVEGASDVADAVCKTIMRPAPNTR